MEPSTESIRELVHDLGVEATQPLRESLVTIAGYYVGREFRFDRVRAVWIASQGQIKFCGDDGQGLRVLDVGQADGKRRGLKVLAGELNQTYGPPRLIPPRRTRDESEPLVSPDIETLASDGFDVSFTEKYGATNRYTTFPRQSWYASAMPCNFRVNS
jgi:hypothetical protein